MWLIQLRSNKSFVISFLRSISSYQYLEGLVSNLWSLWQEVGQKKENILNSDTCHATRVLDIKTGDGLRASRIVDGETGVGSPSHPRSPHLAISGVSVPSLWDLGWISDAQLRTPWRGWSMSSGVLLLDPDDPGHQEFVKRFETFGEKCKGQQFSWFFLQIFPTDVN